MHNCAVSSCVDLNNKVEQSVDQISTFSSYFIFAYNITLRHSLEHFQLVHNGIDSRKKISMDVLGHFIRCTQNIGILRV